MTRSERWYSDLLYERFPKELEVLERQAGAERNAIKRIFGHMAWNTCDLGEKFVDIS